MNTPGPYGSPYPSPTPSPTPKQDVDAKKNLIFGISAMVIYLLISIAVFLLFLFIGIWVIKKMYKSID